MLSVYLNARNFVSARLSREEKGATAVEYGIMVALIAVVIIAAVTFLGGGIKDMFVEAQCEINNGTFVAATDPGTATCS